ncbi:MAG: domain S-box protein [Eubacterium sp.]|nr:domain S-box protein [Eubacterium sp.]
MSEFINNREYRQKVLKEIIKELHNGKAIEDVKARFEELIKGISPTEISEMEQALIMEGMPVQEIQNLCDVHAAVFKGSIEEIHRPQKPEEVPGHPVHIFKLENRKLETLINDRIKPHLESLRDGGSQDIAGKLLENFNTLWEIDKHYSRKENLLFPFMEKYGITAPPKVMWGVDDEIRAAIKDIRKSLADYNGNGGDVVKKAEEACNRVIEMIFKEENILFPMVLDTLAEDEWLKIQEASSEIGYCLVEPSAKWQPVKVNLENRAEEEGEQPSNNGYVKFDAGILTPEEINAMLNTLPVDITFVDKDGFVKYFTQGKERIFARPKTIIGREVKNCHPPASVHIVEGIVEELKSGKKDHEDFWIKMGNKYVHIRYFAVRNEKGEFLGVMEFTQDIKPIQDITGEKRLVSEG